MAWKETDPLKERVKFVLEWERMWEETEGHPNVAALCRLSALEEKSRRPRRSPAKVSPVIEGLLLPRPTFRTSD